MALGGSSRNSRIARCGQPCLPCTALLAGVQLLPRMPDLGIFETLPLLSEVQFGPNHGSAHYGVGLALQRDGQSRQPHEILRRYQTLKPREDQTAGPRVAVTTQPVVGLKRNDVLR